MGLELVVLYCVYAITAGLVVNTTISVVGDTMQTSKKTNADKYVACQRNARNDAASCKNLE